jgi:ABC-type antimicrobial peptide transport system permease subunit
MLRNYLLIAWRTLRKNKAFSVINTVSNIVGLLLRNFVRLIVLAGLLAAATAYWSMGKWLEYYAFRMPISPWLFILPCGLVLGVALLTVSVQTWKAARANPINSLRNK